MKKTPVKKKEVKKKEVKKRDAKKVDPKKLEIKKDVKKQPVATKEFEEAKVKTRPETAAKYRNTQVIKQEKKNNEMDEIVNSYKKMLNRKTEDKVKEKEELKRIENEQRAVKFGNAIFGKKSECVKVLGKESFNKIYNYYMKVRAGSLSLKDATEKLNAIIGNDKAKLDKAFLVEQMVELEYMQSHPNI